MFTEVVILGAGPTGLTAGWHLSENSITPVMLELQSKCGGLASGNKINGNIYEYGTHVFHTDDENLRKKILELCGDDLFSFKRQNRIYIKFQGKYFRYPLDVIDVILKLPPKYSFVCTMSFLQSFIKSTFNNKKFENSEQVLINRFGKKLYDTFFKDYTLKVWGLPCSKLSPEFGMQRVPRSDIIKIIKTLIDGLGIKWLDSHPLSERSIGLLYYTKEGIGLIFKKMADIVVRNGGSIFLESKPCKISKKDDGMFEVVFEQKGQLNNITCNYIISTIPVCELMPLISPQVDTEVLKVTNSLRFKSLVVVGLLIKRKPVSDAFFTYYRDLHFNRLSEPTNHGLLTQPENSALLLSEITCDYMDEIWNSDTEIIQKVIFDLEKEGLIKTNEIIDKHLLKYRYGYPIYELGFEDRMQKIEEYLNNNLKNLFSVGRQGGFQYINMHTAMKEGIKAAEEIMNNKKCH